MTFMAESLTFADAQSFIRGHYGDRASPLKPLGGGAWSKAYALLLDGKEVVARFGAHGDDYSKEQVMSVYSSAQLPIPNVLEVGEAPGGFFAVSERAHGEFLDELSEANMRAVLPSLLSALDAVQEVDVSGTTGYGHWTPAGKAPHSTWPEALLDIAVDRNGGRIQGWRRALESSPTGAKPFDNAFDVLRELTSDLPAERHVIYADWMYHNVLVDHGHINAVVDWGSSKYGDHLYDAAWLLFCWSWSPQLSAIDIRHELDRHWVAQGFVPDDLDHRLLAYQIHIGLGAQAHNALLGRSDAVAFSAEQTMKLVRRAARGD
jgi:hygromycin-B 4-O-kinase